MSRRTRRVCTPSLQALEGRALLSHVLSQHPLAAARDRLPVFGPAAVAPIPLVSTIPTPGNTFLSGAAWLDLHAQYTALALQHDSPVVFLGDSMIYFWGSLDRVIPPGIPGPVGTLDWVRTVGRDHAANFGILGDQTQNLIWRIDQGELAGQPRVAVVMIGINNLANGQSPQVTAAGVGAAVSAIEAASPNTHVLLLSILPPADNPADPLRLEVDQTNALLSGLASRKVRYLDVTPGFLKPDGVRRPVFLPDGLHPALAGYRILSSEVEPVLRQMLAQTR